MIEIPITWLISVIGVLATAIASLAGIIYTNLSSRIKAQDQIIDDLRRDVERMAKGCGVTGCSWKNR